MEAASARILPEGPGESSVRGWGHAETSTALRTMPKLLGTSPCAGSVLSPVSWWTLAAPCSVGMWPLFVTTSSNMSTKKEDELFKLEDNAEHWANASKLFLTMFRQEMTELIIAGGMKSCKGFPAGILGAKCCLVLSWSSASLWRGLHNTATCDRRRCDTITQEILSSPMILNSWSVSRTIEIDKTGSYSQTLVLNL